MSYTDKECEMIVATEPMTFDAAIILATEIGKSHRSVISKAKSLGVTYIPKAKAKAKETATGPTKVQLMETIREILELPAKEGDFSKLEIIAIYRALTEKEV